MERLWKSERLGGFDVLRVIAAAIVLVNHSCSLTQNDDYLAVNGMGLGRLGTAIFFALSGCMAAGTRHSPETWLWHRLRKIYPAFWIVLAVSFFGAWWTGYKSFDCWQVVCQFAGIGLFTHHANLINIVTWFVSLILVLYLIVYLARRSREAAVIGLAIAAAIALALALPSKHAVVPGHALTFLIAYAFSRFGRWKASWVLGLSAVQALLVAFEPNVAYGFAALVLTALAGRWSFEWKLGHALARYSYEWFLVHGLCLHFALRLFGDSVPLALAFAAGLSFAVAVSLRHFLQALYASFHFDPRAEWRVRSRSHTVAAEPASRVES